MAARNRPWPRGTSIVVEVTLSDWIARYEEGYITSYGASVTLSDELHHDQPWLSPDEAQAHWSKRKDLASPDVQPYGNGLQQSDDVSARGEFVVLGVIAVWRRVTFETAARSVGGV